MAYKMHELSALDAAAAIGRGQFKAAEYMGGLLSRIEAREPDVQAWQYLSRELALEQARKLDARQDLQQLPLAGVAVGIKDIIDTAEMPTENGTVLDEGRRPSADAEVVRLLREAGCVIMGKTVTTELAYMSPSKTRNPHNAAHTPGGSSSGSAAAVAAAMVPVALGTQTNGSVIRPASFCGIYALKPTFGLFPKAGVLEEAGTLDTLGVFARSLSDVAAVAEVLAEGTAIPAAPANFLKAAQEKLTAPRYCFVKTPAWSVAEDATKEAFETFAESLGSRCEPMDLPPEFDKAIDFHRTIMMTEIALNFGHYYERGRDRLSAQMRSAIETGQQILARDYAEALRERENLYCLLQEILKPYDAVITPPASGPAPHGLDTTGNPIFCTLWTFLGVPAMNLPLLKLNGMPLGVQLTGARLKEETLFRAAAALTNDF
ncbi:MAG: amidase [Rhodomicrobium sp.]